MEDLGRLQGTWRQLSFECPGGPRPQREPPIVLHFAGEEFAVRCGDYFVCGGTFRLDPSKPLKEIDFAYGDPGRPLGTVSLGVYRLDGDELTVCLAGSGNGRPTGLSPAAGRDWALAVYHREGPGR